jgi:adenylate cyclase
MPAPVRHFEAIRVIPLPRAAVWHVLSHTDRLNRHVGLAPVKYGEVKSDSGGFYTTAMATVGGIRLKWREYPFQWEQDGHYSVVRIYDQGPIERFEGGIKLEELGANETKLTIFSDMAGKGVWGSSIVPLIAKQFIKKTVDFCDKHLNGLNPTPAPRGPAPRQGLVNERLLDRMAFDLKKRPVDEKHVDALVEFLKTAGDGEVAALRPYEWAREEKLERLQALRTCMHAVRTGILNMRWSMMCPNCRVSKSEATTLSGVEDKVHCDLCGISYDLNFDRYIELQFAVHPAVRRANADVYCLSGPFTAPHILVQQRVDPGQTVPVQQRDTAQELRLRVLRANKTIALAPAGRMASLYVFDGETWCRKNNGAGTGSGFAIQNLSDTSIFVAVEKVDWDTEAVTAAEVTSLQEFRDLFSDEVLRPGRQMSIENVTLFFSDLSNSTALYDSIGDGPAYGRVGRHFDFLIQHVTRNSGAVVKTMGDAVMAVFNSPEDATRAALEIQSGFSEFLGTVAQDGDVVMDLKIGLHHGPALVVNSNDRLDYFGRTVNIASRVASTAPQGYFVMTGDMWEFASVQRLLIEAQADLTRIETVLRGVDQKFALVQVKPGVGFSASE